MGGYQQMLRGEPLRAKFRNSWEKPEPLMPGKMTALNFTMPICTIPFAAGTASWCRFRVHGSRLSIAIRRRSSTFPTPSRRISARQRKRYFTEREATQELKCWYCRSPDQIENETAKKVGMRAQHASPLYCLTNYFTVTVKLVVVVMVLLAESVAITLTV